jgi:hypothetical protein
MYIYIYYGYIYIYILWIYIYIANTRNPESPLLKVPEMWTAKLGPAWGIFFPSWGNTAGPELFGINLSTQIGDDPLGGKTWKNHHTLVGCQGPSQHHQEGHRVCLEMGD